MADWAGFLGATMLWVKAAHIIFVIFLMAGLFMMPRFFVYHHQCPVGSDEDKKWIEREDRLRRIILNPSLTIVWLLGLLLAFNGNYWDKYEGYDLDKNGVGDVPFHPLSLFSVITENNPSAMLLFRSFMITLLDKSEKVLPSITPDNFVDKTPLMHSLPL